MERAKTINELVVALKELTFQNEKFEKQIFDLTACNNELNFQNKKLIIEEEKISESAARLVEALTIAKVGSWEINLQTMQVSWSHETRRIFGVAADDEITSHANFMQFVHSEDEVRVNNAFAGSLNNSSVNEIEHRVITPAGDIKIVEQRWHTINHSGTKPVRSVGTVQDITERKRSEQSVIESEAKYRAFFENSVDGILITLTDGSILAANPAACEIFRTTEEEICNGGRFSLIDTSDPRAEILIKERQMTGKAKGELTYLRKDGTSFPGEISSVLFKDSNGAARTSMIIRDITERKNEEKKLTNANAYLQLALDEINTLMNSSLDVICVVDVDGFFIKVSAASEVVWGYKPEELIGKSVFDYISKEDHSQTLEDVERLKDGSSNNHFENKYIHKNGSSIEMEWTASWDIKSRLRYGVGRDVTNKKRLEKAGDQLKKSEQRNQTLFEQNLAGFYQSTLHGKIINCNETFAKMLKYDSAKSLVNTHSSAIYFSRDERSDFIKKALAQQKLNNYEGTLKCKDGSALHFLENVSVHKDSETGEELLDGIMIDITQRKQTQFQLEETQFAFIKTLEEKKVILESIADAFFAVDKDWIVTYWNRHAEEMLAKKKDEIIGKNLWHLFPESTETLSYKKYHQAVQAHTVLHFEDYFQPRNKWYEISVFPLDGGLSVYFKDISERKLSDSKMYELNEVLQRQTNKLTVSNEE
nr:PAS domain-containing protein [Bacteroidota bacterium]